MKAFRRITVIAILAVAAIAPSLLEASPAAAASPGEFVISINGLRASKGLGPLTLDGGLSNVAQAWANQMAAAGAISHNPSFSQQIPGGWTKAGENVGVGPSVGAIFDALVASPGHYRNMVDSSFNRIGVGIAIGGDGRIYTTHNFGAYPGGVAAAPSRSTPKAASPARPAARPRSAATTSTAGTSASSSNPAPVTAAPDASTAPAAQSAASALPAPSVRIVQGLAELGSLNTQG